MMFDKLFSIYLLMAILGCINGLDYIVDIPNVGKVQGSTAQTAWTKQFIMQFLGIPYAESPSKSKRFLPATPMPKWSGVRDGKTYGRSCPSQYSIKDLTAEQLTEDLEDCLNLCIFSKNLTGKVAVMFYIHGGDFKEEDASYYPPNYLLEKDVILVVPQYRLGALGFVSTRSDDIPGNVGVMDIMLALKWTVQNIQYFGGDPKNIMIFGQNSGGAITSLLLMSSGIPSGLFKRGIFQSGSILSPWAIEYDPIGNAGEICKSVECSACEKIEDINKCLKEASVQKLCNSSIDVRLTIQDKNGILSKSPKQLLQGGKKRYPLMAGATKHDGALVLAMVYDNMKKNGKFTENLNPKIFLEYLIENGCSLTDDSGLVLELMAKSLFDSKDLNEKNYGNLWLGMMDVASVCNFKAPLLQFIDLYVQNNSKPIYIYSFDYTGEQNNRKDLKDYPFHVSQTHGDDLMYLFNTKNANLQSDDLEIAKNMVDIWTSFAIHGVPIATNGLNLPEVSNISALAQYFVIDKEIKIGENYLDEFTAAQNENNSGISLKSNLILTTILMFYMFDVCRKY